MCLTSKIRNFKLNLKVWLGDYGFVSTAYWLMIVVGFSVSVTTAKMAWLLCNNVYFFNVKAFHV